MTLLHNYIVISLRAFRSSGLFAAVSYFFAGPEEGGGEWEIRGGFFYSSPGFLRFVFVVVCFFFLVFFEKK